MSVVIRLKRHGRRNFPTYRISVAFNQRPRDGRTLEQLGFYNPRHPRPEEQFSLDVERARHWLSNGALPSHTVQRLLERAGVFEGFELKKKAKRVRAGRKVETKTRAGRVARKATTLENKAARRSVRVQAKQAAAAAAAAAAKTE